ncbi:hypothetical protein ACGFMK_05120 [Amycolatopsis sp. NPDC049252]
MSTSLRRVAAGLAVILGAAGVAAPIPFPCGYSSQGMDAHYRL